VSPRENSVRHLANFYTVVSGLALTMAIFRLVDERGQILPFQLPTFLLCIAFLSTLLPFYHGALRHLDVTYVEIAPSQGEPKAGAFLADFVILFVESCLFIVLAVKITEPVTFTLVFGGLMLFDAIWGFLAHLAFSGPKKGKQELTWAKINFVTLLVIFAFLYTEGLLDNLKAPVQPLTVALVLFVIALARTVVDYWFSWAHGYYSWSERPTS
jgi:hypothetical protein